MDQRKEPVGPFHKVIRATHHHQVNKKQEDYNGTLIEIFRLSAFPLYFQYFDTNIHIWRVIMHMRTKYVSISNSV